MPRIGLGLGLGSIPRAGEPPPATAPAQTNSGEWSVVDNATDGDITISITTLPFNGGSAITDLQYQLDGGSWVSLGSAVIGDYPVSGLVNNQEYDVAVRAVNAIGNGPASATKPVTPTDIPPAYVPSMDFSDERNSGYVALLEF